LTSSNPSVVGAPSGGLVAGQQSVGSYPITTNAVTAPTQVSLTRSVFGVTRTGILTVVPATAASEPDTVRVTSASWEAGHLRINATSTTRLAILNVLLASNHSSMMFTMYPAAQNGTYSVDRPWVFIPEHMISKVCEQEFHDFAYGFRPGRSAHQALQAFWNAAWRMKAGGSSRSIS